MKTFSKSEKNNVTAKKIVKTREKNFKEIVIKSESALKNIIYILF